MFKKKFKSSLEFFDVKKILRKLLEHFVNFCKLLRSFSKIPKHVSQTFVKLFEFLDKYESCCRGPLLGQSFDLSGCGRGPLQDEDHSESRPHSFPGLYSMGSERPPEWLRSGSGVALQ